MIDKKQAEKIHPEIPGLVERMEKREISRREFLRFAALLGMSAAAAGQLAGMMHPGNAFAAKAIKRFSR